MKHVKKINIGGAYARKEDYEYEQKNYEADIKNGDTVTILSGGKEVVGQHGEQTVFKIETRNGEKNYSMNQSSLNILIDAYGEDDKEWVGKEVNVLTYKGTFAGKKGIASYLVTSDWKLDDYNELVKEGETKGDGVDETPFEADEVIEA